MRLDKFLAEQTGASRKQVKEQIRRGRVTLNGVVSAEAERRVDPEGDVICLDGGRVAYRKFHYYMLHKPAGVVSSTKLEPTTEYDFNRSSFGKGESATAAGSESNRNDGEDEQIDGAKTVLELFPIELRKGLSPVGRLDKDTEGLLLLTDDGALLHRLISPKNHIAKVYEVHLEREISEGEIKRLEEGVDIGDERPTRPAKCELKGSDREGRPVLWLTIYEGRYHQIKRMMAAIGNKVIYLKRLAEGDLWLDETLRPGEFRELTEEELDKLAGGGRLR